MSELKCLVCESTAMFSLRTKSMFDYSADAFYVDGIYCHNHYCEELMRIYTGMRQSMTPDYKALSNNKMEMSSSDGTVTVAVPVPVPVPPIPIVPYPEPMPVPVEEEAEEEEEQLKTERIAIKELKQKTLEEKVKHAILVVGIANSYEVAKYVNESRGTVWHAIQRLKLTDKLTKKTRKSYNRFAKADSDSR